jgi:hypothetical protein
MRLFVSSFLLISLFSAQIVAMWPFDYWSFEEAAFPVLSLEVNSTTVSLDNLNEDVLRIICSFTNDIKEKARDDSLSSDGLVMPGQYPSDLRDRSLSAIRSLSMTNKSFRNLATPWLFHSLKIDGGWKQASDALRTLENCPAALAQAR